MTSTSPKQQADEHQAARPATGTPASRNSSTDGPSSWASGGAISRKRCLRMPDLVRKYSDASTEAAYFHLNREIRDLPLVAAFTIDGEPISKARARFTRAGRSYTPGATLEGERRVRQAFEEAAPGHVPDGDTAFGVTALFFHATMQRRDVDNMLKLILDGLNGTAWDDDSQVIEVSGRKCIEGPDDARTEIAVYRVGRVQRHENHCRHCGRAFAIHPSGRDRQFCSRECGYAHRRESGRAACPICGRPITTRRSVHCSRECAGIAKSKPVPRCVACGAAVSKQGYQMCRRCFTSTDIATECRLLDHAGCYGCACICHLDIRIEDQ